MKKKSPNSSLVHYTSQVRKDKNDARESKPNNIHQVRRKIEDILLEREQKKELDL